MMYLGVSKLEGGPLRSGTRRLCDREKNTGGLIPTLTEGRQRLKIQGSSRRKKSRERSGHFGYGMEQKRDKIYKYHQR